MNEENENRLKKIVADVENVISNKRIDFGKTQDEIPKTVKITMCPHSNSCCDIKLIPEFDICAEEIKNNLIKMYLVSDTEKLRKEIDDELNG